MKPLIFCSFLFVALLTVVSCAKNNEKGDINPEVDVRANFDTSNLYAPIDNLIAESVLSFNSGKRSLSECYSLVDTDKGKDLVINNCSVGEYTLNGIISIVKNTETSFTAFYDDLTVNGNYLKGSSTLVLNETDPLNPICSLTSNIAADLSDGSISTFVGTKTLVIHIANLDNDDMDYAFTGNWEITHRGAYYIYEVTTLIEGEFSCSIPISGILAFEKDHTTKGEINFDYGSGGCDHDFSVTIY